MGQGSGVRGERGVRWAPPRRRWGRERQCAHLDRAGRLLGTEDDSPLRHHRAVIDELLVDDPRDERGEVGEGALGAERADEEADRAQLPLPLRRPVAEQLLGEHLLLPRLRVRLRLRRLDEPLQLRRAGGEGRRALADEHVRRGLQRRALARAALPRILGRGGEQFGAAARQRRRRRGRRVDASRRRRRRRGDDLRQGRRLRRRLADAGRLQLRGLVERRRRRRELPTRRQRHGALEDVFEVVRGLDVHHRSRPRGLSVRRPLRLRRRARRARRRRLLAAPSRGGDRADAAVRPDVAAVRAGEGGEARARQFAVVVDGRRRRGAVLDAELHTRRVRLRRVALRGGDV